MKWPAGLLTFAFAALIYAVSNRLGWVEPWTLPLTPLDRAIPFLPWTIWIYMSAFVFLPVAFHYNRDPAIVRRGIYCFLAICVLSAAVFVVLPISYPRDLYPLPVGIDPLTRMLFEFVRGVDAPKNCLPSLHASVSVLLMLQARAELRRHDWRVVTWATLLLVSTLTTKQHYLTDVAGGTLLCLGVYRLFSRWLPATANG